MKDITHTFNISLPHGRCADCGCSEDEHEDPSTQELMARIEGMKKDFLVKWSNDTEYGVDDIIPAKAKQVTEVQDIYSQALDEVLSLLKEGKE